MGPFLYFFAFLCALDVDLSYGWKFKSSNRAVFSTLAGISILGNGPNVDATMLAGPSMDFSPSFLVAVSGGGKDFAEKDIKGEDFSGRKEVSKDFTAADCVGTNFKGATLRGSRFIRAQMRDADFTSADLTGASLEGAGLENAIFKNAILQGAYLSDSILDAKDLSGVDFTDAQMPKKVLTNLCARSDTVGTNPKTGADSRESLFCVD